MKLCDSLTAKALAFGTITAWLKQAGETPPEARKAATGAEARTILHNLRGAEAPLFHGIAGSEEFFRNQ